jgi:hypothetical protein
MKNLTIYFCIFFSITVFSQEVEKEVEKGNKGKMYILWGWNRGQFSDSDIRFKGIDYDFTLYDVKAIDKVNAFTFRDYFNPGRVTIPQTNFRIGYFFKENYTVSIGVDHMKYVMRNYQTVKIDGEINSGTSFDGVYSNDDILLTHDFLTFEHTDGLNYVNIEVNRFDNLNRLLNFKTKNLEVNITEGIGVGFLYPKTNARLFYGERYDDFNVAGVGVSAKVGLNLTFFKHFFLQSDFKLGYINMNDIRISANKEESASQHFTFFERTIMFGTRFQLNK